MLNKRWEPTSLFPLSHKFIDSSSICQMYSFSPAPLFVLQFRPLTWTIAIELIYPAASGPLSILTLWQENVYKLQI